jgi:hypothetical protein
MQLVVDVRGVHLTTLLDSRSTHNFVDLEAATRAGITWTRQAGLHVAVANGDRVSSPGCCKNLRISVDGEGFYIDYYDLALGSYEMVLGVQWLESLGPMLWDFGKSTLTQQRNDTWVLWTTADSPSPASSLMVVTSELMEDLLHRFNDIFAAPPGLPPE